MPEFAIVPMRDPTAYLKPKQVYLMISKEPLLRNKLIIRLLLRGGMRVSEMLGIYVRSILWDEGCIIIPWLKRKKREGQSPLTRKIPLDVDTLKLVREYISAEGRRPNEKLIPLGRRRVYNIVRRAAERVGIMSVGDPSHNQPVHPHTLRHSYATFMTSRTNGDYNELRRVQLAMGHAGINTTAAYLQVDAKELHKSYDRAWEEEPKEESRGAKGSES